MRLPGSTKGLLTSLCLSTVLSCAATVPKVTPGLEVAVMPAQDEHPLSVLSGDSAGMASAAERLCTHLTTRSQKQQGLALARRALAASPSDTRTGLAVARCAYFCADWEATREGREHVASIGIEGAKVAGSASHEPHAAYLHALLLGIIMRDMGLDALGRLSELTDLLKDASALPDEDLGGPQRVFGRLYFEAPPWPLGIGDVDEALDQLKSVCERHPSHPMNHIFYAEVLLHEKRHADALREIALARRYALPELWGEYAQRWREEADQLSARLPE